MSATRRLVMFDVDGTLTQSTRADGVCFAQAMSEHLGVAIDTTWSAYRHSTDSGIAQELFIRAGRAAPTTRDLEPIRRRLIVLLTAHLETEPGACVPTPGARTLLEHLRETPGVTLAIATGAWEDSARLKLRHAGLPVADLAVASGDDALAREEILAVSLDRAKAQAGVTAFDAVTYVGDQPWDVAAAQTHGFHFVGVSGRDGRERLRDAGAATVIPDFIDARETLFG